MNAHDKPASDNPSHDDPMKNPDVRRIALANALAQASDIPTEALDEVESLLRRRSRIAESKLPPKARKPRVPGQYRGMIDAGPEFFEPLPEEELKAWEGG
jgi:hypothetical protein